MPSSVGEWTTLIIVVVMAIVASVVVAYLAIGLFQARSLIRRELSAYFLSPIAYVVLFFFIFWTGLLFAFTTWQLTTTGPSGVEYPMRVMLNRPFFWLGFLFIPPLLTMRLFAEESGSGTLETLMTSPLKDWQIALSKYVACFIFYVILWLPTLLYLPVLLDAHMPVFHMVWTFYTIMLLAGLAIALVGLGLAFFPGGDGMRITATAMLLAGIVLTFFGGWGHYVGFAFGESILGDPPETAKLLEIPVGIDPMPVVSTYLGLAFAGAMFLGLGLLVSSLVRSQMIAALLTLVIALAFIGIGFIPGQWMELIGLRSGSGLYQSVFYFTVPLHFDRDFSRGILDTRHLTLYASVAVFSLFLTVRSLESRRWR